MALFKQDRDGRVRGRADAAGGASDEDRFLGHDLERLGFCACAGIVVIRPLFSSCGVGTEAEDRQFAGDQHLGDNLLVFAAFKVRAGVNDVLARPPCRAKQVVQAVCVGPLVGIRDHLAAQFAVLAGIRYSPIDYHRIKGNLQGATKVLDLLLREPLVA